MDLEKMKSLPPDKQKKLFESINFERQKGKTTNYSCVYGAGGKTIAEAADVPDEVGYELHTAYWKVNWSVKALSADQTIKFFYKLSDGTLTYRLYKGKDLLPSDTDTKRERRKKYDLSSKAESLWLWNPVAEMWYSLRYPKDIFSTLNQGTGVYVFDKWIKKFREKRTQLTGQMHDIILSWVNFVNCWKVQYQ